MLTEWAQPILKKIHIDINKTHFNKQPNTSPEDDQWNDRKRLG